MSDEDLPEYVPTIERIVELHARGMRDKGGLKDYRIDRECIESARGAAINATLYQPGRLNTDGLQVGIYLFAYINTKQCFSDGTKRTAWLALVDVLAWFGLTIEASQYEAAEFTIAHAASHDLNIETVAEWLADRLIAQPQA